MPPKKRLQYLILSVLLFANLLSSQLHRIQELSFHFTVSSNATKDVTMANSVLLTAQLQLPLHYGAGGIVHDNSSWIGNQWIPPVGFRLYSAEEIQHFFFSQAYFQSVLFVGDSNVRRLYGTFYAILNASSPTNHTLVNVDTWDMNAARIIDLNKRTITEVCTAKSVSVCRRLVRLDQMSNTMVDISVDYNLATCPEQILGMDLDRVIQEYNLIVVHVGAWHLIKNCRSLRMEDYRLLLWKLESYQRTNLTIVWITMGSFGYNSDSMGKLSLKRSFRFNSQIRQHVEESVNRQLRRNDTDDHNATNPPIESLTLLDWGSVMAPRSWPYQDRIRGDIPAHYGLEGRLVQVQMLMNHLLGKLQRAKGNLL